MPNSERVLITGAAGFVGRTIAAILRRSGYDVVAHARRAALGIDWVADLSEPSAGTSPLPSDIVAVVHCAAAIPSRSNAFARDNARGTAALIEALYTVASLRRIVHLSSVAAYKRPSSGFWTISEDAETIDIDDLTADAYARSKRESELELDSFADRRPDVKVTHLRPSSIYGPGMIVTTLLPVLVARARRQEPMPLRGPRNYVQNFVHVLDVAELAAALVFDETLPHVINAFSDDTYSLTVLADLIKSGLNSQSQIVDSTEDVVVPTPIFVNWRAKQIHPRFRKLVDHLLDVT